MKQSPIPLLTDGKRVDGRLPEEHRPVTMQVGVLPNANGSALVAYGNTVVLAAVYGPREPIPRYITVPDKAVVRVRYHMAPFSTDDRKNPAPTRREIEISKVVKQALEAVVFLEQYPKSTIDVFLEVLQADGSTRVTSITAASLALADAGIPMRDLVVGVSVGKINDTVIVDLNKLEDNYGDGDLPIAIAYRNNWVLLMQLDGVWKPSEVKRGLELAFKAAENIYRNMREALKGRYMAVVQQ
ncbi:exosome complex exonuclease Rrp41 [Caldivirga sp. UBA161]|uniref:exosome complex exonuclease Rrp41 n=1 Tax=Caldivirga sp. UBA161 TaxID=1915569 RepID=UPI0025C07BD1|nr:exosome complex exonuclease Rrp41 [Caldivirga sp. UBA161]